MTDQPIINTVALRVCLWCGAVQPIQDLPHECAGCGQRLELPINAATTLGELAARLCPDETSPPLYLTIVTGTDDPSEPPTPWLSLRRGEMLVSIRLEQKKATLPEQPAPTGDAQETVR